LHQLKKKNQRKKIQLKKKKNKKEDAPKKEEIKKEEPKKLDSLFGESDPLFGSIAPTKKEEPKKEDTTKKEEPKKEDAPKKEENKKVDTKKANIDIFAEDTDIIFSSSKATTTKKEETKKASAPINIFGEEPTKGTIKKEETKKQDSLFGESDPLFGSIAPTKKEEPKKEDTPKKEDNKKEQTKKENEGFNPLILPSDSKKTSEPFKVIDKQESSSKEEGVKKVAEEQIFYKRPVADVFGSTRDSSLFASDAADLLFSPSKAAITKKEETKKASSAPIDIFGEEPTKGTIKKEEPKKEDAPKKEEIKKEEPKKLDSLFGESDPLFGSIVPTKKEEPKKEDAPKKEETKKEESKKQDPFGTTPADSLFDQPKKIVKKQESITKEEPKKVEFKKAESKKEDDNLFGTSTPKAAEPKQTSKIKDRALALNLNPMAMLPGAAPKIRSSAPISESTDSDESSKTSEPKTLTHITKERASVSRKSKRRPPSRRGRAAAQKKEEEEDDDDDINDSGSSVPPPTETSTKAITIPEPKKTQTKASELFGTPSTGGMKSSLFGNESSSLFISESKQPTSEPKKEEPKKTLSKTETTPKSSLFGEDTGSSLFAGTDVKVSSTKQSSSSAASIFDDPFASTPKPAKPAAKSNDPFSIFDDPLDTKKTTVPVKKSGGGLFD